MKNKLRNELAICGFAAVKEFEKHHAENIRRLYFTAEKAPLFGGLCKKMATRKAIYNQTNSFELEKLCGSTHHQGVVAMIPYPEIPHLTSSAAEKWIQNGESGIILDHIGNANNFGAIVRSAAFFNIRNIVIPRDESQSLITTSTYRVAQGGMEYVSIYSVSSLSHFLSDMQKKMVIIGTDPHSSVPVLELKKILSAKSEKKQQITDNKKAVFIILGNEENGISNEIKHLCDHLFQIPSPCQNIDSLNVAQAASIILYELSRLSK